MILLISALGKTKDCISNLQETTQETVEICAALQPAIALLESKEFSAVVLDQLLLDAEPEGGEMLLKHLGTAVPVFLNFAVCGARRVAGEVSAALERRKLDLASARKAAELALRHELRDNLTALRLSCETILFMEGLPEAAGAKMHEIEGLARMLGQQLEPLA